MGILDSLFGRDSNQSQSSTTTTQGENSQATQTQGLNSTEQAQVGATSGSTLSPEVQAQLAELISGISGGSDIGALFAERQNRAMNAEADVQNSIDSVVADARHGGERQLGQQIQGFNKAAGSSLNTLSHSLAQEGRNDLESQIAGVAGQLELQGRQLVTSELAGLSSDVTANSGSLADVLKGAQVDQRTESVGVANEQQELLQLIETLTKGTNVATGSSSGSTGGNLGDVFNLLLS